MKAAVWLATVSAFALSGAIARNTILMPSTRGYYYSASELSTMLEVAIDSSGRPHTQDENENAHGAMFFVEAIADLRQGKTSCPTPRVRMS